MGRCICNDRVEQSRLGVRVCACEYPRVDDDVGDALVRLDGATRALPLEGLDVRAGHRPAAHTHTYTHTHRSTHTGQHTFELTGVLNSARLSVG